MNNDRSIPMASVHLDLVRGLAALAVLLNHGRALFFVNSDGLQVGGVVVKAFYFLSGFGHQAVIVFFVLSGYFIASSILRAHREGRWSWSPYLIDRGTRIYIVLAPAIVLTLVWDLLGMTLHPDARVYRGLDDHGLFNTSLAAGYASQNVPAVILGNLLCLETIVVPALGSNTVLWSLTNEVLYYAMFPLAVVVVRRGARWAERLGFAVVLAGLGSALDVDKGVYLLIWCLGAGVAATGLTPKVAGRSVPIAVVGLAVAVFGSALFSARTSWIPGAYLGDVVVGLSFALVVLAVLGRPGRYEPGPYPALARTLSGFSYSLYLLHLPLLTFLRASILPGERVQPVPVHLVGFLGLLALVVAYAYVFSRATEAKTGEARRAVSRWVGLGGGGGERAGPPLAAIRSPAPADEKIVAAGELE